MDAKEKELNMLRLAYSKVVESPREKEVYEEDIRKFVNDFISGALLHSEQEIKSMSSDRFIDFLIGQTRMFDE